MNIVLDKIKMYSKSSKIKCYYIVEFLCLPDPTLQRRLKNIFLQLSELKGLQKPRLESLFQISSQIAGKSLRYCSSNRQIQERIFQFTSVLF